MPSGWDAVQLGPFKGGLNLYSDVSAINDDELVECINFELDIDGSLIARVPFQTGVNSGSWTERIVMIGTYTNATGTYLIGSNVNGVFASLRGTAAWTLITATVSSAVALQYNDLLWIVPVPGSGNPGGTWNGTTFTADSDIPQGEGAKIYKERLFITPGNATPLASNSSRLRFSEAGDFGVWPSTNFIDVSKGDGTKLVDLAIYKGNLLLFKNDSTFVLSYDTAPSAAIMEQVSPVVGVTAYRCVVEYENSVFTYHEGEIYELVNYDFQSVNVKVPFVLDQSAPSTRLEEVFLCLLGDRLVFRYYNKVYVYGLRTRTWSEWTSASVNLRNFGPLVLVPSNILSNVNNVYFAGSSVQLDFNTFNVREDHDFTIVENVASTPFVIACSMKTKNYDFGVAIRYKRLFGWELDCLTNKDVTGTMTPVTFTFQSTWGSLSLIEWPDLGPWEAPEAQNPTFAVTIPSGGTATRRLLRFPRAARFRQINFKVEMQTDGSRNDGPCQVYSLSANTKAKELVEKAVN